MFHEKKNLLKIENLSVKYNKRNAISNITISIEKGDVITILGPNGGGKTSLVKAVAGINKDYTGNIKLSKGIKVSYMPQNFTISNLIPMTVEYFLLNSFILRPKKESNFSAVIELTGINKILKYQVLEISAGQTQLMLLARCLIKNPDLIILDEPVSAVDINMRKNFYNIINKVAKEKLVAILMTSHDLNSVITFSDYIFCINNTIYYKGTPSEIIKDNSLNTIFSSYIVK